MSWMPSADPVLGDKRSCDALELVVVPRVRDLGNGFAVRRAMPNEKRADGRSFHLLRSNGASAITCGAGLGRAPTSPHWPCDRHLSLRWAYLLATAKGTHWRLHLVR